MALCITSLSIGCNDAECRYAECRYAECRYAECRYAECHFAELQGALPVSLLGLFYSKNFANVNDEFKHASL